MTERGEHSIEFKKSLEIHTTTIPGLLLIDLPVMDDARGWFKENYNREKMTALGLPSFEAIQNNMSFNARRGVTRGIHAEPWNKYISLATGRVFGAWVDLREGESFGTVFTTELDPSMAIYVPRGVGNAFQALEDGTSYSYLVDDHWSVEAKKQYSFVNLSDPSVNIDWPIPLIESELSEDDKHHPELDAVSPLKPKKILVTGANGQLGKALQIEFPDAEFVDRSTFDVSDPNTWGERNWRQYSTIINAAAYTKVDLAETEDGRREAWKANAVAVQNLAQLAIANQLTLVHVSSDYVFDGTIAEHDEDEPFSPLGVYGQSKAAGDIAAATVPRHYIARTSWVVGDGNNFVRTMVSLAEKGVDPAVVDDQFGRPTFTEDIAKGIKHLLETNSPFGTYNLSNDGEPVSWRAFAKTVFEIAGHGPTRVGSQSTQDFIDAKTAQGVRVSPRPLQSTLNIAKIQGAGFAPRRWDTALREYLEQQHS